MKSRYFPCSLNVSGRDCVVIGNSKDTVQKAKRLHQSGARVRLFCQGMTSSLFRKVNVWGLTIIKRPFRLTDIRTPFLVYLCLRDKPSLTRELFQICQARRILFCALDQPEVCDVVNVSVIEEGPLRITVSTDGEIPALSKIIRKRLEKSFQEVPLENYLKDLSLHRQKLQKSNLSFSDRRKKILEALKGFDMKAQITLPSRWLKNRIPPPLWGRVGRGNK